jgi:hypothetical protein
MQDLRPDELNVDGVVSLYAIFHVRREHQARLFEVLHTFLPAGGPLLLTMGSTEWEGIESDFHGAPMFWSHYGPRQNREIIEAAGFTVLVDEIDSTGGESHQVVLARAQGSHGLRENRSGSPRANRRGALRE